MLTRTVRPMIEYVIKNTPAVFDCEDNILIAMLIFEIANLTVGVNVTCDTDYRSNGHKLKPKKLAYRMIPWNHERI
jgi:hypothetical protein